MFRRSKRVSSSSVPQNSTLFAYTQQAQSYTDCFVVRTSKHVPFHRFLEAFLQSPVFRLERWILGRLLSAPSSQQDVQDLVNGETEKFAVWQVENRDESEILMKVGDGPIRTWLMACNDQAQAGETLLYFGSAFVGPKPGSNDKPGVGRPFKLSIWLHVLYSRVLLFMATRKF